MNGHDQQLAVRVYPDTQTVAEETDVFVRCEADGPVTVQWERVDGILPSRHRVQDGTLTLLNVRENAAGTYRCIASTVDSMGQATAQIYIKGGSWVAG